jgi:hypothetical protein
VFEARQRRSSNRAQRPPSALPQDNSMLTHPSRSGRFCIRHHECGRGRRGIHHVPSPALLRRAGGLRQPDEHCGSLPRTGDKRMGLPLRHLHCHAGQRGSADRDQPGSAGCWGRCCFSIRRTRCSSGSCPGSCRSGWQRCLQSSPKLALAERRTRVSQALILPRAGSTTRHGIA